MRLTTLRQILHEKGFDLTHASTNWKYKGQNTLFWKEKLLKSDTVLNNIRDKILDTRFFDTEVHPLITVFTAENDYAEITISFSEKAKSTMTVHIEYQLPEGDFSFNESFNY